MKKTIVILTVLIASITCFSQKKDSVTAKTEIINIEDVNESGANIYSRVGSLLTFLTDEQMKALAAIIREENQKIIEKAIKRRKL